MHKFILSILYSVIFLSTISAQKQTYLFNGKITDAESKEPLEFIVVRIPLQGAWAVSDQQGLFQIQVDNIGEYSYEIEALGYRKGTGKVQISKSTSQTLIELHPSSLALADVVVTAQEHKNGSTSTISQTAIQHLQPKSVSDLLQLLPGGVTSNPRLK